MNEGARRALTKKGLQTHDKVVKAGVDCIAEIGFHSASTNKIALRAGVTWGTLQHQFGDKNTLLEAIIEYSFDEQLETLRQATSPEQALQERISAMVNAFWTNQNSPASLALIDIIRSVLSDPGSRSRFLPKLNQLRDIYDQYWLDLFGNLGMSEELFEGTKQLTIGAIRGLALDADVRSSDKAIHTAKILLAQTLFNLMSGALHDTN